MFNPGDPRHQIGSIFKRVIDKSKECRKRFMESGREIMRYGFSPDYNFEYQKKLNPQMSFCAKVAKTAEAMQIFGPALLQNNPHRMVIARPWADQSSKLRTMAMAEYLNYTPNQCGQFENSRRMIDEAIGYGRGVRWTGVKPNSLVTSTYDTVRNLLIDPNAKIQEDVKFKVRKRSRPVMELVAMLKEAQADPKVIEYAGKLQASGTKASDADSKYEWEKDDYQTNCVTWYEVYSLVGPAWFKGGNIAEKLAGDAKLPPDDGVPKKYIVTEEGCLLHVMPWEIPFYYIDEWPVSELDFYSNPDSIWPISPLEPGLGYQRAMNWIVTLMMGKFRMTNRTLLAHIKHNGAGLTKENIDRALFGGDVEMLSVEVKGEFKSLDQFLKEFNWSQEYMQAGLNFLSVIEGLFEKATGLYQFLYSGEGERQSRSAQEANIKDRNSRSRLEDMRESVQKTETRIARKEAFAARYLNPTGEKIGKLLGPNVGMAWGTLVRDGTTIETKTAELTQAGLPPEVAQEQAAQLMANAVTMEQWTMETDFQIESGSMRRKDIDQQIDVTREFMQQVGANLVQSPDPAQQAIAFDTMATLAKLTGLEDNLVKQYQTQANNLRQMAPIYQQSQVAGYQAQAAQAQQAAMMASMPPQPPAGPPAGGPPQQQ